MNRNKASKLLKTELLAAKENQSRILKKIYLQTTTCFTSMATAHESAYPVRIFLEIFFVSTAHWWENIHIDIFRCQARNESYNLKNIQIQ